MELSNLRFNSRPLSALSDSSRSGSAPKPVMGAQSSGARLSSEFIDEIIAEIYTRADSHEDTGLGTRLKDTIRQALYIMWEIIQVDPHLQDSSKTVLITALGEEVADETLQQLARFLLILSHEFRERYSPKDDTGSKYMNMAVSTARLADHLLPDDHPNKAETLHCLGFIHWMRFDRIGELSDIEEAIKAERRAVDITPDEHPNKPLYLNNYADSLARRIDRLEQHALIWMSVALQRNAVALASEGHPHQLMMSVNLQRSFSHWKEVDTRYHSQAFTSRDRVHALIRDQFKDFTTVSRFINEGKGLTPKLAPQVESHPEQLSYLSSLGGHFTLAWKDERIGNRIATAFHRYVVSQTPDEHPDKAKYLTHLADSIREGYAFSKDINDFQEAFQTYMLASNQEASWPSVRLFATRMCDGMFRKYPKLPTLYQYIQLYRQTLLLVQEVAWLGDDVGRRYEELLSLGDIARTAAALALESGQVTLAVEWLEEGRGVVWNQVLRLRTPLDELRELYPELAQRFQSVSHSLEDTSEDDFTIKSRTQKLPTTPIPLYQHQSKPVTRRTRAATEYKTILNDIRRRKGFERFLLPKQLSELAPAPGSGIIIVINVDNIRCDALAVLSTSSVVHARLPDLTPTLVEEMRTMLDSSLQMANVRQRGAVYFNSVDSDDVTIWWILERLWTLVVHPILSAIEKDEPTALQTEDGLPHVTWCTTSDLAFLPIHAAGIYGPKSEPGLKAYERVVSSYTPTLSAISRRIPSSSSPSHAKPKLMNILAISQPDTPEFDPLPGTTEEVARVKAQFPADRVVHLNGDAATVSSTLEAIDKHAPRFIHLACHGIQDMKQPMNSSFVLHDGLLSLSKLTSRRAIDAELAFLSACQTATGDRQLPEESVHLAAGMLAVGFRSVIGTMWSIGDEDAPLVAEKVYARLTQRAEEEDTRDRQGSESAYALHEAVGHLRKKVGERNYLRWIPFVHFGG